MEFEKTGVMRVVQNKKLYKCTACRFIMYSVDYGINNKLFCPQCDNKMMLYHIVRNEPKDDPTLEPNIIRVPLDTDLRVFKDFKVFC
jgi:acetyl-CoA carboxylase beta subunit